MARLLVAGTSASRFFVLLAAVRGLKGMMGKVDFHTQKIHPGFLHGFDKQCTAVQIRNSPVFQQFDFCLVFRYSLLSWSTK